MLDRCTFKLQKTYLANPATTTGRPFQEVDEDQGCKGSELHAGCASNTKQAVLLVVYYSLFDTIKDHLEMVLLSASMSPSSWLGSDGHCPSRVSSDVGSISANTEWESIHQLC